jgi:hypothetical protein
MLQQALRIVDDATFSIDATIAIILFAAVLLFQMNKIYSLCLFYLVIVETV